jgi:hypothetical protein
MKKLMTLVMVTFLVLAGCGYNEKDLTQAKYVGREEGIEEGKIAGFKACEQSISKAAETLVAQIKMKNEVIDRQRESALGKALACSNSLINLCPDSWMVDIQSYQKLGYSGMADEQTFWIALGNRAIPGFLILLFLIGPAMIYKHLKLDALAKETKKLDLIRQELKSGNSKLDDRIANLTQEENTAMRRANMERLYQERMRDKAIVEHQTAKIDLENFRSESEIEKEKSKKERDALVEEIDALKTKQDLFGD